MHLLTIIMISNRVGSMSQKAHRACLTHTTPHTHYTSHTLHLTHTTPHTHYTSHTLHLTHTTPHTHYTPHTLHLTHTTPHTHYTDLSLMPMAGRSLWTQRSATVRPASKLEYNLNTLDMDGVEPPVYIQLLKFSSFVRTII